MPLILMKRKVFTILLMIRFTAILLFTICRMRYSTCEDKGQGTRDKEQGLKFNMNSLLFQYTIHLADNAMIIGQRNAEWCGHGPVLEQDIAITNITLDL